MSNFISKKAYSEYFESVVSGKKSFDLRAGDFEVEPGDIFELVEIDSQRNLTGRAVQKRVGTVVYTKKLESWYDPKVISESGYVVISLLGEEIL